MPKQTDRNVVVRAAKFREILQDASSHDEKLEATDERLNAALALLVKEAGGDMAKLSEEQEQAFGAALAAWLAEMIEEL